MMWRFWEASSSAMMDPDDFNRMGHFSNFGFMHPAFGWVMGVFCLVTWVLVMVALVALTRLLWKKGDK